MQAERLPLDKPQIDKGENINLRQEISENICKRKGRTAVLAMKHDICHRNQENYIYLDLPAYSIFTTQEHANKANANPAVLHHFQLQILTYRLNLSAATRYNEGLHFILSIRYASYYPVKHVFSLQIQNKTSFYT